MEGVIRAVISSRAENRVQERELVSVLTQEFSEIHEQKRDQLMSLLRRCHMVFSLNKREKEETNLTKNPH